MAIPAITTDQATAPVAGGVGALHEAYLGRRRFGSLDGLRCFSILAVLWHHSPVFDAMLAPPVFLARGFLGVDFFFVLSGFLITTLLLRERSATGRFSLRGFYWRRILRIVPVYFLLVSAASAWFILVQGQEQYLPMVPFYYLFLANFLTGSIPLLYPLWSLSVEEQYYLIWPVLLRLLRQAYVLPLLGLLIALNVAISAGVVGIEGPEIGVLRLALPNATYAPILMGSALALILHERRGFLWVWRIAGGRLAPLWSLALLLFLIGTSPADLRGLPNLAIHLAMTLCLASLALREDNLARPLLGWAPLVRIGVISYGIYLYHLIGRHFALVVVDWLPVTGATGLWLATLLYVVLSVAIADISFRRYETWFHRFRHKRPRTTPAA